MPILAIAADLNILNALFKASAQHVILWDSQLPLKTEVQILKGADMKKSDFHEHQVLHFQ